MSVRNQWKLLVGGLSQKRKPEHSGISSLREFMDSSRLVAVLIFVVTVATIVLISSVGMTTLNLPVLPGQTATISVTASVPFTYVSEERTKAERDQFMYRVPPVYTLDLTALKKFETASRSLLEKLNAYEVAHPVGMPAFDRKSALAQITDSFNQQGGYHASVEDIEALLQAGDAPARAALFDSGLSALREIAAEGVHGTSMGGGMADAGTVYQVERPGGEVTARSVQSMEEALTFLRVSLLTEGISKSTAQAIFRFFANGVAPNLEFDSDATKGKQAEALARLRPVAVTVERGETIIQAGERITPDQYEMFLAHRRYLMDHGDVELNEGLQLFGRVLLVLAMVVASLIYIRLEDPETLRSNVRLGLLALVVIVNLAVVRAIYSIAGLNFFITNTYWASILPYVAPTALAPLIVAILIDAGSAIFMALLISIFTGVIYGNRMDLLVLTFLASMVAIYVCRDARRRGSVVRAAAAGGLTIAAFAALVGLAEETPFDVLGFQMAAGLVTGIMTGIGVVGFLPVLESLFKRTTDITLLELSDYNHPLLRRMQMEAPGTYHHSLVVAQLAENACNAIGAHPLQARVCALFHDIGKVANPSYFTENQRDRGNPHDEKDPVISAAIIKAHVTDGLELAAKYRLPKAVVDVIRQHHGTTLVRYFYNRAVALSTAPFPGAPTPVVPEGPFRYDGPKPQFKESAVISLADVVEAATRSLRSATAEQLTPLVDRLVMDRIAEGQLDLAPLTFEDIAKVKNSFTFTLLNMLHARTAYETVAPYGADKLHKI